MGDYKNIEKAALEISRDNGGINRFRTEAMMLSDLDSFLAGASFTYSDQDLATIDRWLGALSADDFVTVCCGEHGDIEAALRLAPPLADRLLTDIFDKVS